MRRIRNNQHLLSLLCSCDKKMFNALLYTSGSDSIKAVCECILNCLNGNIKLTETEKNKISKYKIHLRNLLKKSVSIKKKKQILNQYGGSFLPIIIPAVLSTIASFLS